MGRKQGINKYDLSGAYGVGYASNTNSQFLFDHDDFSIIKNYHWNEHILTNGYHALEAWDRDTQKIVRMQWVIMGKGVDHINHNPLDNRRCNLRIATQAENVYNRSKQKSNTSGITGVHWMEGRNKWRAQIKKAGIRISKEFSTFEDAVKERLHLEALLFGEFAPQAILFRDYGIEAGEQHDLS